MAKAPDVTFVATDLDALKEHAGRIAAVVPEDGKMGPELRRLNRLAKGAVERAIASSSFEKAKPGEVVSLGFPSGMSAEALDLVKMPRRPDAAVARRAGVAFSKLHKAADVLLLPGRSSRTAEIVLGALLRHYSFETHKSGEKTETGSLTVMLREGDAAGAHLDELKAVAEGVFFTRDLVNEPANVLTTTEFAERLKAMESLGLKVEVLEEPDLEKLKMGSFLSVGQGSAAPTKLVVMRWEGGKKGEAPLALVGKGVVFDTGGISLKPAQGMEEMTMDMGGAGVVAGVMRTLALRGARANVVGLVGLVENMPSGTATRPGDIVTSMKGDTIEVNNTDAEGRLVLADVMWYAQERFKPSGMIDLATLTGAVIVALGHENAGIFSNDDDFCNGLLKAAGTEGEGAWRLPLGQGYDDMLKSQVADMKNSAGRPAGSITAAQFLKRFVNDETPWIHIDIAGVAYVKSDTTYAPKGATGWGVMTLNRLVADRYESDDGKAG